MKLSVHLRDRGRPDDPGVSAAESPGAGLWQRKGPAPSQQVLKNIEPFCFCWFPFPLSAYSTNKGPTRTHIYTCMNTRVYIYACMYVHTHICCLVTESVAQVQRGWPPGSVGIAAPRGPMVIRLEASRQVGERERPTRAVGRRTSMPRSRAHEQVGGRATALWPQRGREPRPGWAHGRRM